MAKIWDGVKAGYKLWAATTVLGLFTVLIITTYYILAPTNRAFADYCLKGMVAALVGWITGVAVTPYNAKERSQFFTVAKAVGVFISGYVFAAVQKTLTYVLDPAYLFSPTRKTGDGFWAFVAPALISFVVVFTHRQYRQADEFERKRQQEDLANREEVLERREEALRSRAKALPSDNGGQPRSTSTRPQAV